MPRPPSFNVPDNVFQPAIKQWWELKETNTTGIKLTQGGTRDSNLRGDTINGFRDVIISRLKGAAIGENDIFAGCHMSAHPSNLPSYLRATKNWDVIVIKNSHFKRVRGSLFEDVTRVPRLLRAVEFKSEEESMEIV